MAHAVAEHEERSVREYVEGQLHDDEDGVTSVERVSRHRIAGQDHEIFDVHTVKGRWWVITPMTNLYSQDVFKTADFALSFHLGLMMRLTDRDRLETKDDRREAAEGSWRRYSDAVEAFHQADDAEDFQAIGVRLREALLALVRTHANADWIGTVENPPKRDDLKGWMEVFAAKLCEQRRQRVYLKTVADKTWDLVVHLQHNTDANPWDVELALDATGNVLGTFMIAKVRHDRGQPQRCPNCGSYRYHSDHEWDEENGKEGFYQSLVCAACDYRSERGFHEIPSE